MTQEIEKILYKWFEMKYQTYDKLEYDDSIYLYYEGQKYADIVIYKKHNNIYYNSYFKNEFSEIFPIELDEFNQFISKWVEDTFNLRGFTPEITLFHSSYWLKISK